MSRSDVRPDGIDGAIERQLLTSMHEAAERGGFALADAQGEAASRLAALGASLAAGDVGGEHGGIYLWGPVGRGKTWLLDRFFEAVPVAAKRRFHFQQFFREFNQALAGRPIGRPAVAAALEQTIGGAQLVCFDELYAHETGDASLLTRLLEELVVARRLPLVVTSNYPPQGLLPDAEHRTSGESVVVSHRAFARGIELIEGALEVISIDDGMDFRLAPGRGAGDTGFRSGRFLVPGSPSQLSEALGFPWPDQPAEPLGLAGGRRILPRAVVDRCIGFDFREVCERPIAAGDILGLATRYTTWVILDVPPLGSTSPEAAQRFVNLIDVLHDTGARMVLTSDRPPDPLLSGDALPPDGVRARSRLALLRLVTAAG